MKKPSANSEKENSQNKRNTVGSTGDEKVKLSKKAMATLAMIDRWLKEGPSDEDGSLEDFKAALERNREGERKLFRD